MPAPLLGGAVLPSRSAEAIDAPSRLALAAAPLRLARAGAPPAPSPGAPPPAPGHAVRRAERTAVAPAPEGPSAAAPAVRGLGSRAAAVAAATGAELAVGVDGTTTLTFEPPAAAGRTLARASAEAPPAGSSLPAPVRGAGGTAAPRSAGAPATDVDDVYDQVVERLRRDLLAERERMGDLFGDLL